MQTLPPRLSAAYSFLTPGGVPCDVGTDHAYLPIAAILNGLVPRAAATDLNEGPLARAKENALRTGTADRIRFLLCDGLKGAEPEQYGVTDVVICGMGGELIAKILNNSPFPKTPGVRLILQPMTKGDVLRAYLLENGFSILDERLAADGGRIYACLCAAFSDSGSPASPYTPAELLLGRHNIRRGGPLFSALAERELLKLERAIQGLREGGLPTGDAERLREEIREKSREAAGWQKDFPKSEKIEIEGDRL